MVIKNNPSITIFFPCYNDAKSIKPLAENAIRVAEKICANYEVIIIDDGSTDNSRQVLTDLAHSYKKLKLIFHKNNIGYGGALQSGFKEATKDLVFYTDGDGQYDVNEIPLLYNLMTDDIDFVNGIKMVRHDPTNRVVLGNMYSMFTRWLFWTPIYDVDCDFRLIRREVVQQLNLHCNSGAICIELVKKAQRSGARFRQVSIHHYERRYGKSQFFRADRLFYTLFELLLLWFNVMFKPYITHRSNGK
jgi:glycosyltransferase involved in cell wall biosynthesis